MDSANGDPPSTGRVSPFGYLRIQACSAAPRSFSQPCHVLHRFLAPKHPPCTLGSLTTASSKQTDSQRTSSRPMRRSPAIRIPPRSCVPGLETGEHLGLQPQTREQHLIVKERNRPLGPGGAEKRAVAARPTGQRDSESLRVRPLASSALTPNPSETHRPTALDHAAGRLVEMIGIEPTTSALQRRRSPN